MNILWPGEYWHPCLRSKGGGRNDVGTLTLLCLNFLDETIIILVILKGVSEICVHLINSGSLLHPSDLQLKSFEFVTHLCLT